MFIGNDTGLMHIAAAAGTPTLGLFGPSPVAQYAPWGRQTAWVRSADRPEAMFGPGFDHRTTGTLMDGLSVDAADSHGRWSKDIEETQGAALNFPLIADHDRKVANLYGMIHPSASDTMTVRSVFVIDPNHKLRLTLTYPASTGRNFDELLRTIDSLQLTDKFKVATPVNWKHGEDVIIVPSVTNEQAKTLFPQGWTEHKPYLRTVKQPNG